MIFTPTSRRRFRCWSVAGLWRVLGCESRTLEIIHLVFQGDAFSPRLDQREWTSSRSSRQCKWYKKRYKEWPSLQKCLPSNGMRHLHTLTTNHLQSTMKIHEPIHYSPEKLRLLACFFPGFHHHFLAMVRACPMSSLIHQQPVFRRDSSVETVMALQPGGPSELCRWLEMQSLEIEESHNQKKTEDLGISQCPAITSVAILLAWYLLCMEQMGSSTKRNSTSAWRSKTMQ